MEDKSKSRPFNLTDRWLGIIGIVVGVAGFVIGVYGVCLTIHANKDLKRAEALQQTAQKASFENTFKKLVFFDEPPGGWVESSNYSQEVVSGILNAAYSDVSSQMENTYLVLNTACYKEWRNLQELLVLGMNDQSIFPSGHSLVSNYNIRLGAIINDCGSL